MKDSDVTYREHLEHLGKQGHEVKKELEPYPKPDQLWYLFSWFTELSSGRTYGMSANPITWLDIEAYNRLLGKRMKKWEILAIKKLDAIYLNGLS
jgi:hypothetical protein